MNNYVLYHKSCMDGTGAAFAAHKFFSEQTTIEPVKYIPVQYGGPFPDIPLCKETAIYIVDFSYDRKTLVDVHSKVGKLVVLDHHKTAQEELMGLEFAHFDMGKSGAVLAWEYFHPGTPIPDLMRYIQDRDLWKFELPGTRPLLSALVNRNVLTLPVNSGYSPFTALINASIKDNGFADYINEGQLLDQYRDNLIASYGKSKSGKVMLTGWGGLKVGVYNLNLFISEAGTLVYSNLDVDFSMSYFITELGVWVFSLRSADDKVDVGAIAKFFGGGGHAHAAGFSMDFQKGTQFFQQLLDNRSKP